jgi:hypothetical protein
MAPEPVKVDNNLTAAQSVLAKGAVAFAAQAGEMPGNPDAGASTGSVIAALGGLSALMSKVTESAGFAADMVHSTNQNLHAADHPK